MLRFLAFLLFVFAPTAAVPQGFRPPPMPPPPAPPAEEMAKLEAALSGLPAGRPGTIEAFVVAIALDGDPVFSREARAAADVLRRRFGASGRTIVLAGPDAAGGSDLPSGSPATLAATLERVAQRMNRGEDALILYSTSHGVPAGLIWDYGPAGRGLLTPDTIAGQLEALGIGNRLLILSACHSGVFVPWLRGEGSVVITAAAADRTSFGCAADNDWTFFGDALINHAMRRPQPLGAAFAEARGLIDEWEQQVGAQPSRPQIYVGAAVGRWLLPLERRMPTAATRPVGRPSIETTAVPAGH